MARAPGLAWRQRKPELQPPLLLARWFECTYLVAMLLGSISLVPFPLSALFLSLRLIQVSEPPLLVSQKGALALVQLVCLLKSPERR